MSAFTGRLQKVKAGVNARLYTAGAKKKALDLTRALIYSEIFTFTR